MLRFIRQGAILLIALILSMGVGTAQKPKLVINIVVGSMRASDLDRFGDNFSSGGFRRLVDGGYRYTNAYYDYAGTNSVAGLATLATGAQPSVHGIIGQEWWSNVDGSKVTLSKDSFTATTLGDMLLEGNSKSKHYTVAIEPTSAIALNGKSGVALWADNTTTHWTTSSAYLATIPSWIKSYNNEDIKKNYILKRWTPTLDIRRYINSEVAIVEDIKNKSTQLISDIDLHLGDDAYGKMLFTPAGNTMVLNFATSLITHEALGRDAHTDILNIYLDTSRHIAQTYGPESIEYEDMLYRLDSQLSQFLSYLYAQFSNAKDIVIILTSDHGTSPSYNRSGDTVRERLNPRQIAVLTNAFLGARHGSADYILGVDNNAIYLNHDIIAKRKLDINAIREEVAGFVLQIRGVANAISATALRNGSFIEGRNRLLRHSYYPTRSGDVILDLIPGCIIERDNQRASSDGGYNYDRKVPLVIYRAGEGKVIKRKIDMTQLAVTIAQMAEIEAPWTSEAEPLEEF